MTRRVNAPYPKAFIRHIERQLMNILEYYNYGAYAKLPNTTYPTFPNTAYRLISRLYKYKTLNLVLGTSSRLRPYHFTYPERELTMEEILHKFIDEGKRKHEEMSAFINDFKTTNEILFKEQDNSLIELKFEDNTNKNCEEPPEEARDKPVESNEVLMENQPQGTNAPIVQQSIREQMPSIPFPKRLRKENEEDQQ
ncbi:hypothetical protein Tco_0324490 [Tanacetum coccineum]